MSIPEVGSKNRLLAFLQVYLHKVASLVVTDLSVPARSTDKTATPPVDFEQVGGLVIGETYLPNEESSSSTFSWTLANPPTSAQDWHPSTNNDFYGLAGVTFVVPKSGTVRIQVRAMLDASSGNKRFYFRLCTDTSGTSLGNQYQKMVWYNDENNDKVINQEWIIQGLTPGTLTNYYLGAAMNSDVGYVKAGGQCTGDTDVSTLAYPQFTMRAIAVASNAESI